MKKLLLIVGLMAASLAHASHDENHQNKTQNEPVFLSASEIDSKYTTGNMSKNGIKQVNLIGDPTKNGLYVIRLQFEDGTCLPAHSHYDDRNITVQKGIWQSSYGNKFDKQLLKDLPAGSFYTEPKGLSHFTFAKGKVELQIMGFGPSGREWTDKNETECK